jgi:hypothetical protein
LGIPSETLGEMEIQHSSWGQGNDEQGIPNAANSSWPLILARIFEYVLLDERGYRSFVE